MAFSHGMERPTARVARRGGTGGFTLIELVIVLMLVAVFLGMVVQAFGRYNRERSAQQAAYLLSRDIRLARAAAVRSRTPVSLVMDAAARAYEVRDTTGQRIVHRSFAYGDLQVQAMSLELDGDSVTFDEQGVADLSGVAGAVAQATVSSPGTTWVVRFNATGSSSIEEQ